MLSDDISQIKGIGNKYGELLKKSGINTKEDLIKFIPSNYNLYKIVDINFICEDINITIKCQMCSSVALISKMKACIFSVISSNKRVKVIGFGMDYLRFKLKKNIDYTLFGLYKPKENTLYLKEVFYDEFKEFIEPIYSIKIPNKILQKVIGEIFSKEEILFADELPISLKNKYNILDYKTYLYRAHFPKNEDEIKSVYQRTLYEAYLKYNIRIESLRYYYDTYKKEPKIFDYNKILDFIGKLKFRLTSDQMDAVTQILLELRSNRIENRLIQGDVGSGKTIVAIIALYANYLAGYMGALMVPSEVLSYQHYNNIKNYLAEYGIRIELLNSTIKQSERKQIISKLDNNEIDILVGTHSLFNEDLKYHNLGLVVIDEQHRFGVLQRQNLINKGINSDSLFLTATPIPRTLGISRFLDLDITSIKTKPEDRKKIMTKIVRCDDLEFIAKAIYKNVYKGHQVFVVVPMVLESVDDDIYTIDRAYDELTRVLKDVKFKTLHGSMKNKEEIMNQFKNKEFDCLISTTVIEVGIDIKNATLIVIYNAERFGLSTLHQLRGRVGRNDLISGCILASNKDNMRLKIMEETNDCFTLSDYDLKMRGFGDIFGISQSGFKSFDIEDERIFGDAKNYAKQLYNNYIIGNHTKIVERIILDKNKINKLN